MKKIKFGLASLTAKTMAVITAALGSLTGNDLKAQSQPPVPDDEGTRINYEQFQIQP